jgi:hypothetical protein
MNILDQLKALQESMQSTATPQAEFKPLGGAASQEESRPYFLNREYISRSDLLRCEGNHVDPPKSVFRMGTIFDTFFTEPHEFLASDCSEYELVQLLRAKAAAKETGLLPDAYWQWHDTVIAGRRHKQPDIIKTQREIYRNRLEVGADMAIKAKCKLDYWLPGAKTIIDLKSTTKPKQMDFMGDITKHDLALQAAYYLDIARAETFTLLVVSYANPHTIQKALSGDISAIRALSEPPKAWLHKFGKQELEQGREKYRRLACMGIEKGLITNVA